MPLTALNSRSTQASTIAHPIVASPGDPTRERRFALHRSGEKVGLGEVEEFARMEFAFMYLGPAGRSVQFINCS